LDSDDRFQTRLDSIPGSSADVIERLAAIWITSVEQLVSIGMTTSGVVSLSRHMGMSEDGVREILASAESALSPEAVDEIRRRTGEKQWGLGAIDRSFMDPRDPNGTFPG